MSAFVAFLHFLAAFALFAALAVELMLTRGTLDAFTARRLLVVDGVFGISATVVLLAGIARVLWFAKGPAYYLHDIYFIAKMALFVAVGLLSIYPTLQFLRMRPVLRQGGTPALNPAHQQAHPPRDPRRSDAGRPDDPVRIADGARRRRDRQLSASLRPGRDPAPPR